jgi:tetratricopeptide (TPR) repeat protein
MLARIAVVVLTALLVITSHVSLAHADGAAAKKWYEKATAAYGLGDYATAADAYEKAYQARPDGAILFNAAQAHRLAGNNARAIQLYRNYLRIHPDASNREEIEKRIAVLETEAKAPSVAQRVEPVPPPVEPAPASMMSTATPTVVVMTAPVAERKPVYKKGWFWGAVIGGAVVVGVALGVGLALGLPPKAPSASFGHVEAN